MTTKGSRDSLDMGKNPKSDNCDSLAVITNRNQHFHEEI